MIFQCIHAAVASVFLRSQFTYINEIKTRKAIVIVMQIRISRFVSQQNFTAARQQQQKKGRR